MKPEDVPDALVEAVAAAHYDRHAARMGYVHFTFAEVAKTGANDTLDRWRDDARAALTAVIPLIEAREREACAKVADQCAAGYSIIHPGGAACDEVASAIRARGETQ